MEYEDFVRSSILLTSILGIVVILCLITRSSSSNIGVTVVYESLVEAVEYNQNDLNVLKVRTNQPNPKFTDLDAQKFGKIYAGEHYLITSKYDKDLRAWRLCNLTLVEHKCQDDC